ncbi:hypothetical protein NQZ79_g7400 [Umbelopsis isabellina]|nr:hypothetical protein NQZ79_g7400 [Umbelopsis isabellina]
MDLVRRARAWSSASTDTAFSFGSATSTTPLNEQISSRSYYEPKKKKNNNNNLELYWQRLALYFAEKVRNPPWRKAQVQHTTRTFHIIKNRTHKLEDPQTGKPFISNTIRTARYSFWDFLPRQLVAQFSKLANFYFLFVAAIQLVPSWSPTGQYTTLLPLAIFTSIAMAHEGYDDWRRSIADKQENNKTVKVLRIYHSHSAAEAESIDSSDSSGKWYSRMFNRTSKSANPEYPMTDKSTGDPVCVWQSVKWSELRVGDYVMVEKNEWIPADLILLHSSEEQGLCYLETAALDGETNHKSRQAVSYTNSILDSPADLASFEDPNLYQFDGYLQLPMRQTQIKSSFPLTINNILLRGTLLRNTAYVYGLVAFTGEETKIRLNSTMSHTKSPRIQGAINKAVIAMFCFLLGLSALFSALSIIWSRHNRNGAWYLHQTHQDEVGTVFQFIILFNTLIPISLYVTMEIVKFLQACFISWDQDMYHAETDTPAQAQTCTINEDLGQISFVFTDKTGTLTDNCMEFRKCSVGGFSYTHESDGGPLVAEPSTQGRKRNVQDLSDQKGHHHTPSSRFSRFDGELSTYSLARRAHSVKINSAVNAHTLRDRFFLLALAICHTAVPEKSAEEESDKDIIYQAASPDEAALVAAARDLGFTVIERTLRSVTLKLAGEDEPMVVEILNIIEFTSDRKRMSIVAKLPTGETILICKGADSVILERMEIPSEPSRVDDPLGIDTVPLSPVPPSPRSPSTIGLDGLRDTRWEYTRTLEHLQDFATDGLRTLLYAYRILTPQQYSDWNDSFQEACLAVSDRQSKIDKAAEVIECNLRLIGASAIEDKLQDGVPEAIETIRAAGMKVWMLTGDKRETAINIGYSCRLIQSNSNLIVLGDQTDLRQYMEQAINDLQNDVATHAAFVVDGATLETLSQEEDLLELFCHLGCLSDTVICCRVSPSQKALVVKSIRQAAPRAVTLAIGDGANDIAMIQEAHVGIGITGKEGMQASRASDYCFAQFRFLCKLLLVHGHWSYVRVSRFVLGTFSKVVTFYLTQGIFQFWTGYSGTSLYESWTLSMYNTLFSSLPVISVGIFEQDLKAKTLLANPHLYIQGQLNYSFNLRIFITWVLTSVYQAIVVVLVPISLITEMHYFTDGGYLLSGAPQIYTLGSIIYTIIVIVVTLVISYVENHNQTWISHLFAWIELIGFFIYQIIYGYAYPLSKSWEYSVHGDFIKMAGEPTFWCLVFLVVTIALLPSIAMKVIKNTALPNVTASYQQAEKDPELSEQWDELASKWKYQDPETPGNEDQISTEIVP